MGKTTGYILIAAGIIAVALVAFLLFVQRGDGLSSGGAALGFVGFTLFVGLPLIGGGIFFLTKGKDDAAKNAERKKQRQLLNMVKAQGQVDIDEVAVELDMRREAVQTLLHDLVGKGLYSGYIKWDEGVLYSEDAGKLRELTSCRNCGGNVTLAGKGVVACPYCGTEYFLD
ncbi:MAG: hypothetical protein ACPG8W_13105 [Candidatus Promineifilaceae bacterium]